MRQEKERETGELMSEQKQKPGPANTPLSVERILEAALEINDVDGIDALSMRRLGQALGVDPMAIYHHLPNKHAIIRGLVQQVFQEMEQELVFPVDVTWQERVQLWAAMYLSISRRHHHLIIHLIRNADASGEQVMRVNEALYAALAESRVPPRDVLRGADMIVDYLHGLLLSENADSTDTPDWRKRFADHIAGADSDELPAIRKVFASVEPEEMHLDHRFAIDVILAGLERRSERSESM
jgi:TetR/AcrR family transcriptional regulator, tetracycline repressor protein